MLLGPQSNNLTGLTVNESMSVLTNSCPSWVNACNATGLSATGQNQGGSTTFGGFQIPYLTYGNQFYDEHYLIGYIDDLGAANMSSCQMMCMQTYYTNGCPSLTSYTLIKWLNHSTMSGVPISVVTMSQ
ncbi:MAG: hypothetical protein ABSD20_17890 [Terriglobales bacterium]|jgi:hypothetical protein